MMPLKPTLNILKFMKLLYFLLSYLLLTNIPVRLAGLADWESGEVRLCLLPTSSEGDVGKEDIGGVCARRVGSTVVVG